jgi:hypothetical protein
MSFDVISFINQTNYVCFSDINIVRDHRVTVYEIL